MKSKSIQHFLYVFLLYFIGSLLTTQSVNGGTLSDRDLDTLLLRSGQSNSNVNQGFSRVPKEIQDLVSSAPAVSFDSIPKRLQPIIQYALDGPYPGKGIEASPGSRSNNKLKKTIVYLITSRLRQRGNNNEIVIENETPSIQYGSPSVEQPTQNVFRSVLQEIQPNIQQKPVSRTVLQPKSHYSSRNALSQQTKQSVGRTSVQKYSDGSPSVLTIHPRPTPATPDFEIIRTVSSEAGPILDLTQKQNLQSVYNIGLQQGELQEQSEPSSVTFVNTQQQTGPQEVDEGLSVLGGPEGLTDIVSKIEGLGEAPQPNQLVLTPNSYSSDSIPVPVPIDVSQINHNLPQSPQHHTQANEYITYLNPPLVEETPTSIISLDGPLKTRPFKRINRFFQNVIKSFRSNLASLRNLRPKVTYESDPWQSSSNHNSNDLPVSSQQHQTQSSQPVLVSTTTYSEPQPQQGNVPQGNGYQH